MSLSQLVDMKESREVYAKYANRILYPENIRKMDIAIPPVAKQSSVIGIAYQYMLRFCLAKAMNDNKVNVCDNGWRADRSLSLIKNEYPAYAEKWKKILDTAWDRYLQYIQDGSMDLEKIAICAQYLANADSYYSMGVFNPDFKHNDYLTKELLSLENYTDYELFGSPKNIIMSPSFISGDDIGGADIDIVTDNMAYKIKTSSKIEAPLPILRYLSGCAVLQDNAGLFDGSETPYTQKIKEISIYYARFGIMATWSLDEIFNGRFDDYKTEFNQVMEVYKKELEPSFPKF